MRCRRCGKNVREMISIAQVMDGEAGGWGWGEIASRPAKIWLNKYLSSDFRPSDSSHPPAIRTSRFNPAINNVAPYGATDHVGDYTVLFD